MRAVVKFSSQAVRDLQDLFDYLEPVAGPRIARAHVARLYAYCLGFETFPERGRLRDDLRPGLRIVGYRRQATIAFAVLGSEVTILRIVSRGRDVEAMMTDDAVRD